MSNVILPIETARLIRSVFLPRNPRKMRNARPDTIAAVDAYLAALSAAELGSTSAKGAEHG